MIDAFLRGLESIFAWLIEASWQASVLVALVLLLHLILRGRLNPRWHHALWLLVVARLLLPFLPESALSLFQFAPSPPQVVTETVTEAIFTAPPAPIVGITSVPEPPVAYPFSVFTVLALIWLTGALALLILTWQVNRRFARHVVAALLVTDPRLLKLAEAAQQELGLHRRLRIIESAQVQSPAIMGLFRPTLILPKDVRARFDDDELRFIFLHEFAHLKRGDLFLQWLVALLQILHWFNPVLWYGFRRMRADREPATDALVLSCAGEAHKESYGQVLVKLLEHYHQRHSLPTLVGILEDKDQFKRRFSLIARFTRGAYGWSLLGVPLMVLLSVVCLTKAKAVPALIPSKAGSPVDVSTTTPDPASNIVAVNPGQPDRSYINKGFLGSPLNPQINLVFTLVEIDEKTYEQSAKAMDEAVRTGDVQFFASRKDVDVAPDAKITFPTNKGWYSVGVVQSLIGSVAYDKLNGKTRTTIQARAIFIGVNADFVISSSDRKGISMDSTWSEVEPSAEANQKFDLSVVPANVPSTLDLSPKMHAVKFIDKGWKIEPGIMHGFWVGETLGQFSRTSQFKDRSHASLEEMIKAKTPSRLAVFMSVDTSNTPGHPKADPTPRSDASKDLDTLKKDLLTAKEDANARRVLVIHVKDLPDDQFLAVLVALGRSDPTITALQSDIEIKNVEIKGLLKSGFTEDHPRVQALKAELAAKQEQLKPLVAGVRRAMQVDLDMANSRVTTLTKEMAATQPGAPAAVTAPPGKSSAALELDDLEQKLRQVKEDADARRVLFDRVKDLPDDQFLGTLAGLGRSDPTITALQKEIADKNADIAGLLKSGFTEDHSGVAAQRAELASLQQESKRLTDGLHSAMIIDCQMADSRVALLQNEVDNLKAQTSPPSAPGK
jgi:bla regulator protein blaR1